MYSSTTSMTCGSRTRARPSALPRDAARPVNCWRMGGSLLIFVEAWLEQCRHLVADRGLILAIDAQTDLSALSGGQQHDAHDAFRVDLASLGDEGRVALVARQQLHQFGGGASMQAQAVGDGQFAFDHGNVPGAVFNRGGVQRDSSVI